LREPRIIDSNCYLGAWPTRTLGVTSARGLEALLRGNGVGLGLVSPLDAIFHKDHLAANARMMEEVKRLRESFLPVPVANPASPLGNPPWKLARLVPPYHQYSPAEKPFLTFLNGIRSRGGVAFISVRMRDDRLASPLLRPATIPIEALTTALKRLPGLKVVVNNARSDEVRTLLSETGETVVAGCEWSFPTGFLEEVVDEFGDRRLVFGSNAPLHYYASSLLQVTGADIPRRSMRRILADNIREMLPSGDTVC